MARNYRTNNNIYHLTTFSNLPNILTYGLLPRSELDHQKALLIHDVANQDIINFREQNDITHHVPFHFFMHSPFAGDVMSNPNNSNQRFLYIVVLRKYARDHNFKIIPRHPMCLEYKINGVEVLDYDDGMNTIDWDTMNKRDYTDQEAKLICMAECISDESLDIKNMLKTGDASLAVKTEQDKKDLLSICNNYLINWPNIWIPKAMF